MTKEIPESLKALYKEPCTCVICFDCRGSGDSDLDNFDGADQCFMCHGSGIIEECQRCMDIAELESSEP